MKILKFILSMFIVANIANATEAVKSKYDFETTMKNIKNIMTEKKYRFLQSLTTLKMQKM